MRYQGVCKRCNLSVGPDCANCSAVAAGGAGGAAASCLRHKMPSRNQLKLKLLPAAIGVAASTV